MTFCHAILPNAGLGNRLFPWARCRVFAHRHGATMLAPRWVQLKVGPLVRGESDWRTYAGLFQPDPDDVVGLRRQWLLHTVPRCAELDANHRTDPSRHAASVIVEFVGFTEYFAELNGHAPIVREALNRIVRARWLRAAMAGDIEPIGIHVRRGDFVRLERDADLVFKGAVRTPLPWFVQGLQAIRRLVGAEVPAFVVSDGTPGELAELLSVPAVRRVMTGSSIGDLLTLSRARVVMGSGGSSFSQWASYLGQSPIVTVPGPDPAWFNLRHANGSYVGALDVHQPDATFLDQVIDRLATPMSFPARRSG